MGWNTSQAELFPKPQLNVASAGTPKAAGDGQPDVRAKRIRNGHHEKDPEVQPALVWQESSGKGRFAPLSIGWAAAHRNRISPSGHGRRRRGVVEFLRLLGVSSAMTSNLFEGLRMREGLNQRVADSLGSIYQAHRPCRTTTGT